VDAWFPVAYCQGVEENQPPTGVVDDPSEVLGSRCCYCIAKISDL